MSSFKSAHGRAVAVKILLIVGMVVTFLSLVTDAFSIAFPPLSAEQEVNDNPVGAVLVILIFLLAVIELVIYLTTVVLFCMWLYRSYNNLRAFNQWTPLDYSAGLAVGSFFIPFVNLVLPYRAVREVWQKSIAPDEALLSAPTPPASFPLWWLFWLLASFAGQISLRASLSEHIPESNAAMISIVASALSILAAIFVYLVVDAIDKRQEETSRKVNLDRFPGPPPPPNIPPADVVAPAAGPNNF